MSFLPDRIAVFLRPADQGGNVFQEGPLPFRSDIAIGPHCIQFFLNPNV